MRIPAPVPEIPVSNVDAAAEYYVDKLGFTLDWGNEEGGIAGISQGDCRLFLTNQELRRHQGNVSPVVIWLNLTGKAEVDELHSRWRDTGAIILAEPEDKPWNLREFRAADPDGNQIRVFYDFAWELKSE